MRSRSLHGLLAALILTSIGCATTTSNTALRRERDAEGNRVRQTIAIPELVASGDLIFLRDAAALSAAVYGRGERLPTPDWEPVENAPQPRPIAGRLETPELTYRVWANRTVSPPVALVVFRGTFLPLDWYSNLRWVTAAVPRVEDHYDQTIAIMPAVVQHIRETVGTDARILAAGHSLGGGLAQTAAYATCGEISTVFAFDSSPVTKHRVRHRCANGRSAETFYRVFERSEVLAYVRFWIRLALGLRQENPKIVEIKVALFDAFGIRAHSMDRLAVEIDRAVRSPQAGAPPSPQNRTAGPGS